MNRTLLVFALAAITGVAVGLAGKQLGFGFYPQIGVCLLVALAITQLDRERFYGNS